MAFARCGRDALPVLVSSAEVTDVEDVGNHFYE